MRSTAKRIGIALCSFILAIASFVGVCAILQNGGVKANALEGATTENVEVGSLHEESGFIWFQFSPNDYIEANFNDQKSDAFYAKLNALNTLSKIKADGKYLSETIKSFSSVNDPCLNLWGKGGFNFVCGAKSEIVIENGCEFPSLSYAKGTDKKIYVTASDVTFTKNGAAWVKALPEKDITNSLGLADWGSNWSADTTQIMILLNAGVTLDTDSTKWINDNPNTFSTDLAEYIEINRKTVRSILQENAAKPAEEQLKGKEFPMSLGGAFSPVGILAGAKADHIQVMILKSYADQGTFTFRIKKGFTVEAGGNHCVVKDDIVYGYRDLGEVKEWKRMYEVTWVVNGNKTTVLVPEGDVPQFEGTPTKESTVDTVYTFSGWDVEPVGASAHVTYTAQFTESVRQYLVTFQNEDGSEFAASKFDYNTFAVAPETDPVKEPTNTQTFKFDGWYNGDVKWDFAANKITQDVTLKAKFTAEERKYTVTFQNEDGSPFGTEQKVSYEGAITAPESDPTKDATAEFTYKFDGWYNGETKWDFAADKVTQDLVLKAKFSATKNSYKVTIAFEGIEGKQPVELTLEYGAKVDFSKYAEEGYTCKIFSGDKEVTELTVSGNAQLKIVYEKEAKGGCSGFIVGGSALLGGGLLAVAAVVLKKRRQK